MILMTVVFTTHALPRFNRLFHESHATRKMYSRIFHYKAVRQ
jgi:hypothetical protein